MSYPSNRIKSRWTADKSTDRKIGKARVEDTLFRCKEMQALHRSLPQEQVFYHWLEIDIPQLLQRLVLLPVLSIRSAVR